MKTGLTLGKYAPFHHGHEHVINTALEEVDNLIVVVYDCPEIIDIPLSVRAGWIRDLYKHRSVEVIEAWDGPTACGNTPEIKAIQEAYIKGLLKGRTITHFYSGEFYGKHMSKALGAIDRRVSKAKYRISGSKIRENPSRYRGRHFRNLVYKDFITKVVFLGAPSTGKTTMAQEMAKVYNTNWMPEYGRQYWEEHNINRRLTQDDLYNIAVGHNYREAVHICNSNKYFFIDTNTLTTRIFSLYYHGEVSPQLDGVADKAHSRYDLVFLCDTDIPYDNTPDRSGDGNRIMLQKQIIADLVTRKIPYITLSGTLAQRVSKVNSVLATFKKYENFTDKCIAWPSEEKWLNAIRDGVIKNKKPIELTSFGPHH